MPLRSPQRQIRAEIVASRVGAGWSLGLLEVRWYPSESCQYARGFGASIH